MRRWLIISGILLAVLVAAVALLPWWLGIAVGRIGPRFGLTIQRYERDGYARFTVHGVEYRRGPVRVTVERVSATTPLLWLFDRFAGKIDPVVAGRWTTEVTTSGPRRPSANASGWVPLRRQLRRTAAILDRWVPRAEVGDGSVSWPNGGLTFGPVRWSSRTLTASRVTYRAMSAAVTARFPAEDSIRVEARDESNALTASVHSEGEAIEGELGWAGQRATTALRFAPAGWRPTEAHLRAERWSLPAERVKMGAQYAVIEGEGTIAWDGNRLSAALHGTGKPRDGSPAPPLVVDLRGNGHDGEFVAEALKVNLPGVTALLTEPVVFDRNGRLRATGARFSLQADLAQLPWFSARGTVRGEGRIAPGRHGLASIEFSAAGADLAVQRFELAQLDASGRFEWPELHVTDLRVRGHDGREARASAGWNFKTHELLAARAQGSVSRAVLAPWLPSVLSFESVSADLTAAGRWPDLRHGGNARVERLRVPGVVAVDVAATWKGVGLHADRAELRAAGEAASLLIAGSADLDGASVTQLELHAGSHPPLELAQPFRVNWRAGVQCELVRLAGGDLRINLAGRWARAGQIELGVDHLTSDWLRAFVVLPRTEWSVESLQLRSEWQEGPATFQLGSLVNIPLGSGHAAVVAAQLHGDARGLQITQLRVSQGEGEIVTASGNLPVVFHPTTRPLMNVRTEGPFNLDAQTTANPSFWAKLTELSGVEIVQPEATVHLKGTLADPRGEAEIRAARIAPVAGRFDWKWPKVENVSARLTGNQGGIRLDAFTVEIDGQTIRIDGWVPVPAEHWAELARNPRQLARKGDLRVQIPDAQLSAIAPYVPAYLAPTGRLAVDLTLRSDETLHGFLRISDAASRPLGPLGVLQEVNAEVRFEGRRIRLQEVTARMGGQLVRLQGQADLPAYDAPRLDFTLTGENLPFVRRTGLLVRGDLGLTLKTQADGETEIGGEVRLRDSLFLADIRSFLPNGNKGTTLHPPYFSVDAAPLNTWHLNVLVHGDKFIRLRTPVFNGVASTRVQLLGVLASPRAIGNAVIEQGTVRLPFASFEIKQGEVRLTPEQPEPQVMVIGTTRRYGYDLRMELSGAASSPNLTFSSSPPLESEQVLLMVMAGQAPHNEVATTERQRAARFGAFFGQSLLGALGGGAGGSDRLTISSGEDISAQGRETYSIEYKLNDRWSLTGEYDQFDEYNGGVKVRVYQKGGRKRDEGN